MRERWARAMTFALDARNGVAIGAFVLLEETRARGGEIGSGLGRRLGLMVVPRRKNRLSESATTRKRIQACCIPQNSEHVPW